MNCKVHSRLEFRAAFLERNFRAKSNQLQSSIKRNPPFTGIFKSKLREREAKLRFSMRTSWIQWELLIEESSMRSLDHRLLLGDHPQNAIWNPKLILFHLKYLNFRWNAYSTAKLPDTGRLRRLSFNICHFQLSQLKSTEKLGVCSRNSWQESIQFHNLKF